MSKYYRTIIEVVILSEEPIEGVFYDLEEIANTVSHGDWSGAMSVGTSHEVSKEEMTELLIEQGSDPEFFGIEMPDNEGDDAADADNED